MAKQYVGITSAKNKPKFNPATDSRRAQVLQEYQNAQTSDKRRQAIDQKWGFSKDPNIAKPQNEYDAFLGKLTDEQRKNTFVNQNTPQGSLTYTQNPDGSYTQTTALNPQDQARLDWQRSELARLQPTIDQSLSQPLTFDDLGKVPTAEDFGSDRDRVEAALMDRAAHQLDPQYEQEKAALDQHLASSGIPRGSEQYTTEMDNFDRRKAEAFAQARDQATIQGQTEQANQFNRALTSRQQQINERITKRSQPLQEYAGILGTDAGLSNPQFPDVPKMDLITPGVNIFGIKKGQEQAAAERQLSAKLAADQNATQLAAARIAAAGGGGGGGGMSLEDYQARADIDFNHQMALDQAARDNQKKPPGLGTAVGGIIGAGIGGFASGFGQSFGAGLGKPSPKLLSTSQMQRPKVGGKGLLGIGNARLSGFR